MILLVLLAADAVCGALADGRWWRLVLAGVWVGLAFQAKMLEAWLVLPALAVTYLVAGPGAIGRRLGQAVVGGAVAITVSLSWMVAVSLVPAGSRPYVDGSSGNSLFEQVFVYNGLGRVGEASPLQVLAGQGIGLVTVGGAPSPVRLFVRDLGHEIGWLLPLALAVAVAGVVGARGRPRTDRLRRATCCGARGWSFSARRSRPRRRSTATTPRPSPPRSRASSGSAWSRPRSVRKTLPGLQEARGGAPDLLAVQSAAVASVFSYPDGDEVLPR